MRDGLGIDVALKRLEEVLPVHAPVVWSSLRPGVGDDDLGALSAVVAPYALPTEVVTFLRWAAARSTMRPGGRC